VRQQFRRDDRRVGMRLAPGMARDQPDDPFGLGRLAQEAGIDAPSPRRSSQSRPSGLTMISTTRGSASASAIDGPMALRNMARRRSAEVSACPSVMAVLHR
jgi:hypothetical protein